MELEKGQVSVKKDPLFPFTGLQTQEAWRSWMEKGGAGGAQAEDYIQAILTNEEELRLIPSGRCAAYTPISVTDRASKGRQEIRLSAMQRHAIRRKSTGGALLILQPGARQ